MESHAQPSDAQHREIVGAVAYGDGLLQGNFFLFGNLLQQLGLARSIDDLSRRLSCKQAIGYIQFVGVDVVKAKLALQLLGKAYETAREDSRFVSHRLEGSQQPVYAGGDRQPRRYTF